MLPNIRGLFKNKSILFLVVLNLVLAISAFIKDITMAEYFGTTRVADAFTLGFFIPDTLGNNLLATGLGVTCIPIFSRLIIQKRFTLLNYVFYKVIIIIVIGTGVLSLLLWGLAKPILLFLGNGFDSMTLSMMYQDFILMVPLVILFPLLMVFSALLQSRQKFVIPALGPIIFNVIWFIGLVVCLVINLKTSQGGIYLSLFLTIAGALCLIYYLPFLNIEGVSHEKKMRWKISPYVTEILRQLFPYIIILLFSQSLLVVERSLASGLMEGSVAALSYAYRLVQFPIWVVVAALSTVLLPSFSKDLSLKNRHRVTEQMKHALRFVIALSLIASLGLYLFRNHIISILFERGAFNTSSVKMTSSLLSGYSWAILGQSVTFLCLRYYTAQRKLIVPLLITGLSFIISWGFDWTMIDRFGATALGYGASIGASIGGLLFIIVLYKEWGGSFWSH